MTMTPTRHAKTSETAEPPELLIKEAHAASRRRRLRWLAVSSAVVLVVCLITALIVGGSKPAMRTGSGDKNPKETALTLALCTTSNLRVASDRAGWHANFAAAGQF